MESSGEEDGDEDDGEGEGEDDDEQGEEHGDVVDDESCNGSVKKFRVSRKSEEEKVAEAADRSLDASEQLFKPWEPVFVVVQIGSQQFKVSNGGSIFTERLKFCDVNDKALDAKVIIFKKKRRKNYHRTKGHQQELTKLRITHPRNREI